MENKNKNVRFDVRYYLPDVLLARRLLAAEQAQAGQQLALGGRVGLQLGLLVGVDEQDAEVAAAAALAGLQERLGDVVEDVDGGGPVGGLDVARRDDPGLLLGLVELPLADALLQPRDDLLDLVAALGAAHDGLGEGLRGSSMLIGRFLFF